MVLNLAHSNKFSGLDMIPDEAGPLERLHTSQVHPEVLKQGIRLSGETAGDYPMLGTSWFSQMAFSS
jgi:hypothetical protein